MADARRLPLATLWPDERTLQAMLQIKTAGYFPFADTLIAATAQAHKLALIHKDPHFDSLPVQQLNLTKS
jgi:predicted nucleic acid-binding protein